MSATLQGLILSAGVGSRLSPYTTTVPKALIRVGGEHLLKMQVDALQECSIQDITVVTGHLADDVSNIAQALGIRHLYNEFYRTTNNLASLRMGLTALDPQRPVLVLNGDILIDGAALGELAAANSSSILVKPGYNTESMKVSIRDGQAARISKALTGNEAHNISLDAYLLHPVEIKSLLSELEHSQIDDWETAWAETGLQHLIDGGSAIGVIEVSPTRWAEIDTIDDLLAADEMFWSATPGRETTLICDIDGTVVVDGGDVEDVGNLLRASGIKVLYATNNSSRTPPEIVHYLKNAGISATEGNLVSSLNVAAEFLDRRGIQRICLFATPQVKDYFQQKGFAVGNDEAEASVLAYNNEATYADLVSFATSLAANNLYVATHSDCRLPSRSKIYPDAGSFVALFAACTGRRPDAYLGKESVEYANYLDRRLRRDEGTPFVFGDNLETDAILAQNLRAHFGLVLTGVTTRHDLQNSEKWPDIVASSLAAVLTDLG